MALISKSTTISRLSRTLPRLGARSVLQLFSRNLGNDEARMMQEYADYKERLKSFAKLPPVTNDKMVFANNEIDLSTINIFGFDFDYTLVNYTEELDRYIYCAGRDLLVDKLNYPKNIKHLDFNPFFAVRGLHYDVLKGLLLKVDEFHNIQLGAVYRGLTPVSDDEVINLYKGIHIAKNYLTNKGQFQTMTQLMDLFAIPEMNLLANVIEYFNRHEIDYDPEYLFYDVTLAVRSLHKSGAMHNEIMSDLSKYIEVNPGVPKLLQRLVDNERKVFLITNSGHEYINKGMNHIIGTGWRDLFDVIIVGARKPSFFTEEFKPFRKCHPESGMRLWEKVTHLGKGAIYQEGNLKDFQKFTNWPTRNVLYIGDHMYSDLADVSTIHGWHTGAIIPELAREIEVINSKSFQMTLRALTDLEQLIDINQEHVNDAASQNLLTQWLEERKNLRFMTKKSFNPQFGSLFRTYHNHSYFTQRLALYADLYTSSVTNLLGYNMSHTFYPRRTPLPHEAI